MFREVLAGHARRVDACAEGLFHELPEGRLTDAMRYAVLSGGKRLRAFLVLEGASLYGVRPQQADRAAAAVECVHAYSLIHDDLPAMDDDELRRGKPTVHVRWDEATAILAGDALQALAFDVLASARTSADANIRLRLLAALAEAAGPRGMVLGQMQDIEAETAKKTPTLEEITRLQANKTGALFRWAAEAGPIMGKANTDVMRGYADCIGLAYQIADDILDVEGDTERAGKRLQKDEAAGKATFVSLLGLEGARKRAWELVDDACDGLELFGGTGDNLRQLARFIVNRDM
ncbi:MAG: polyprenyl synthetase family protein [Paracoccaceae bacterium]